MTFYGAYMPILPFDILPRIAPTSRRPVTVNVRLLPADARIPAHAHNWAQLACTLSGAIRLSASDTTWVVPPTRAVWIPPHVEHALTTLGEVSLRTVYVAASAAPRSLTACEVVDVSALMRELVEALAAERAGASTSVRHGLLTRLLLEEIQAAPTRSLGVPLPADRRVRSLCQALLAEPATALTLEDWATQVGASPRTLARLFQSELGMGFGQWRQQVRLAHAAALISQGQRLSHVALELGYESASAFSAMFRRAFGQSPKRFFAAPRIR
jgi:AraC-like DNA-binding protein